MDTYTQPLEDHERWFYGGTPPESDSLTPNPAPPQTGTNLPEAACRCASAAHGRPNRWQALRSTLAWPL